MRSQLKNFNFPGYALIVALILKKISPFYQAVFLECRSIRNSNKPEQLTLYFLIRSDQCSKARAKQNRADKFRNSLTLVQDRLKLKQQAWGRFHKGGQGTVVLGVSR